MRLLNEISMARMAVPKVIHIPKKPGNIDKFYACVICNDVLRHNNNPGGCKNLTWPYQN